MSDGYEFTSDWFSHLIPIWQQLIDRNPPGRILEVGAYEGRSTCFLIEACAKLGPIELHCIDTWEGGVDNDRSIMGEVERRFDHNVRVAAGRAAHPISFHKHKTLSHRAMADLLARGNEGKFDLIYVDGSHQAPDVLSDAIMAFHLARVGGYIFFDDYLWSMEPPGQQNAYNMPKPAIDAFINTFQRKVQIIGAPLYQLYTRKISN